MDVAPHLTNANHQDYLKESKTELLPAATFTTSSSAEAPTNTSSRSRKNELETVKEYGTFVDEHTAPRDVSGDATGDEVETGEDFHAVYMSFLELLCGMLFTRAVRVCPLYKEDPFVNDIFDLCCSVGDQTSKTYRGNKAHGLGLCQQDPSSQHADRSIERPTTTKKRPWSKFAEVF